MVRITTSNGKGTFLSSSSTVKVISEPSPTTYRAPDSGSSGTGWLVGVAAGRDVAGRVGVSPLAGAESAGRLAAGMLAGTSVGGVVAVAAWTATVAAWVDAGVRSGKARSPPSASPWVTSPPPTATAAIRQAAAVRLAAAPERRVSTRVNSPDRTKTITANGTVKTIIRSNQIFTTTAATMTATSTSANAAP